MVTRTHRVWISIAIGFILGQALLILAFALVLDTRVPMRTTVALCPFAAGLWVLMWLVTDPLLPDAHPAATAMTRTTALLTAICAGLVIGWVFFIEPRLV